MPASKNLQQLFDERDEILWAPCIYDCLSAKVAETIGFEAVTISSIEQTHAFTGMPAMTLDEMITSTVRIIESTSCAVLVDGESGGADPLEVYRNVKRLAEAGAMAVSIEDQAASYALGVSVIGYETGSKRAEINDRFIPAELWAANVQAAVDACKGTDCMVVARVESKGCVDGKGPKKFHHWTGYGLEESIRRAQMGREMGAQLVMVQNVSYRGAQAEWEALRDRVGGWLVYPDVHADDGVSDVDDVNELYDYGFRVVSCHGFQKGAWKGMLEYGQRIFRDKNTVYTENDDFGFPIWQLSPFTFPELVERSDKYIDTYNRMKDFTAH